MIPSPDLNLGLEKFLSEEAQEKCEKCAYVVPVYEISGNASKLPENKTELLDMIDQERARVFHEVTLRGGKNVYMVLLRASDSTKIIIARQNNPKCIIQKNKQYDIACPHCPSKQYQVKKD